jgi:type IV secretory pathway VirB10-like protein
MNRLDGDTAGPVKVLVSNPVYSHDRQHILMPEGRIVLGEARKIGSNLNSSGPHSLTNGAASSVSHLATTILDKFIQIPPTITIREGHCVMVYFTQDLLLPAYQNHCTAQSF